MKLDNKINCKFSYLGNLQKISLQYLEKIPLDEALIFRDEILTQFPYSKEYLSNKTYEIILENYKPKIKLLH